MTSTQKDFVSSFLLRSFFLHYLFVAQVVCFSHQTVLVLFSRNTWIFITSALVESYKKNIHTLQSLYNTVRYNKVLDITRFIFFGSQKCIDYCNLYIFVSI